MGFLKENILFSFLGRTLFEVHSEQVYLASPPNRPRAEERGRGTLTCGVGILRRHRITSVLSAAVGNPNGPPNVLSGVKNPTQQRESFTRGVKFLWRNLQTARMQKRGRVTERERERRLLAMSAFLWRHPTTSVLSPPAGNPNGPPNLLSGVKKLIQQKETFTRGVNSYGATSKSPACRKEKERERERERNAYLWCRFFSDVIASLRFAYEKENESTYTAMAAQLGSTQVVRST